MCKVLSINEDYSKISEFKIRNSDGSVTSLSLNSCCVVSLSQINEDLANTIKNLSLNSINTDDYILGGIAKSLINVIVKSNCDYVIMPKNLDRLLFLLGRLWHGNFPTPLFEEKPLC